MDRAQGGGGGGRDWIEVRLLGPLRVRRADGQHVQDRDWRTTKNSDLLRWLALQAGEPVPVEVLTDKLWPDADEARGRSSLRTAVSQIRRVLGADAVERVAGGLVLTGCWVDAPAFLELAEDVARHVRLGRWLEAFAAAREADALYVADMPVADGAPPALVEHAAVLATAHQRLLGDAAEAALELGWVRDAVELAERLREVDPVSERASRALMLGYAGAGEVHHALQEYERCRRVLAEELGVDPSPQTQAAHLKVLQPTMGRRAAPGFVGRASERSWLEALLDDAASSEPEPGEAPNAAAVVVLAGAVGSGRRRLAQVTCRRLGLPLVEVTSGQDLPAAADADRGHVLLWVPDVDRDRDQLERLLAGDAVHGPAAVLVVLPAAGELPALDELLHCDAVRCLSLEPLLVDDVTALVQQVVGGRPLPSLLEELQAATSGQPGPIVALLDEWVSTGRLVATSRGVAVTPKRASADDDDPSGRRALSRALHRLEGDALEALQLAAVLDQPITPALLAPLLAEQGDAPDGDVRQRARATSALEQLVDLALLRNSPAGAVWRHPLLRDAVHAWMRPAVKQRLHRRIAGQAPLPSAARVEHWLEAGERELACVAALEAAAECSARADHAGARKHLLEVCSLGDLPEAGAEDRVELFESLGDACGLLRRPEEACAAYSHALDIALKDLLPSASRLRRKLEGASDPRAVEMLPAQRPGDEPSIPGALGTRIASAPDRALEASLRDAVEQADRRRDSRRSVAARLDMAAAVHLPRRDFRGVHQWVEQALALDARPAERLRAVLVRQAAPVLLGGAQNARDVLEQASEAAESASEEALWWHLLGMRVLVAHDLGEPGFDALWKQLSDRVLSGAVDELVPELATIGLRVLAEREEYDLAATMSHHLSVAGGLATTVMQNLARLASAELAAGIGDNRHATDLLRSIVAEGSDTGCTLLVPEAAARLVVLEAAHDPAAARTAFEVYDEVVGAALGGPREEFWRRLSRASVRAAHDDVDGAVAACTQASALAAHHGLQVLAARARRARAEHLRRPVELHAVAVHQHAG